MDEGILGTVKTKAADFKDMDIHARKLFCESHGQRCDICDHGESWCPNHPRFQETENIKEMLMWS